MPVASERAVPMVVPTIALSGTWDSMPTACTTVGRTSVSWIMPGCRVEPAARIVRPPLASPCVDSAGPAPSASCRCEVRFESASDATSTDVPAASGEAATAASTAPTLASTCWTCFSCAVATVSALSGSSPGWAAGSSTAPASTTTSRDVPSAAETRPPSWLGPVGASTCVPTTRPSLSARAMAAPGPIDVAVRPEASTASPSTPRVASKLWCVTASWYSSQLGTVPPVPDAEESVGSSG